MAIEDWADMTECPIEKLVSGARQRAKEIRLSVSSIRAQMLLDDEERKKMQGTAEMLEELAELVSEQFL